MAIAVTMHLTSVHFDTSLWRGESRSAAEHTPSSVSVDEESDVVIEAKNSHWDRRDLILLLVLINDPTTFEPARRKRRCTAAPAPCRRMYLCAPLQQKILELRCFDEDCWSDSHCESDGSANSAFNQLPQVLKLSSRQTPRHRGHDPASIRLRTMDRQKA